MGNARTNRKYNELSDTALSRFSGKVAGCLTASLATYDDLPVTPAQILTDKGLFDEALIKADQGGSLATAIKNAARAQVIYDLNKDASYVDIKCDGDMVLLLSSGYEAASMNRAQALLNPPQIIAVQNRQAGELRARVKADPNSKSFVGRIKPIDGEYGPTISFASTRDIIFDGLKAGITYVFQLMAIGGSTGESDWSDPGQGMSN